MTAEVFASGDSFIVLVIKGKEAFNRFQHEGGIHCVQRVPPTEKGGRVHTSIISVAVLPIFKDDKICITENEIEVQATRGSGPGGQHRNKTSSAVRMIHKPTGLKVFIDGRKFHQNRKRAFRILSAKVRQKKENENLQEYGDSRHEQVGTRGRGNKIRTYNFKKRRVVDHRLNKKTTRIEDVMNGRFDLLF